MHLAPKAMLVLRCLARANGAVVSRQELFDTAWPGCVVSDDALTQRIVEIRRAFNDPARTPGIIETIPKVGFRLIPKVEPLRPALETPGVAKLHSRSLAERMQSRTLLLTIPLLLVAGLYLLVNSMPRQKETTDNPEPVPSLDSAIASSAESVTVTTPVRIAVLPFESPGSGGEDVQLMHAVHEEVLTRLTRIAAIRVISHASAERYRHSRKSPAEIARELGVSAVVSGSVQRTENRMTVHARLIDTATEEYLWAERFEFELNAHEYFAAQAEIALEIATALSTFLN